MITTNDKSLYEKLVPMTWLGISSTYSRTSLFNGRPGYSWNYEVDVLGYKCYMIDLTAALGLSQMKKLQGNLEKRRYIQSRYNKELTLEVERPPWSETVQYYSARVGSEIRNELIDYLAGKKIHTSVHFKPLHMYNLTKQNRSYPVADKEWLRLITLPCFPTMSDEDIDYVVYWVNKFFNK
jgi:perosamine synthetase